MAQRLVRFLEVVSHDGAIHEAVHEASGVTPTQAVGAPVRVTLRRNGTS